MPYQEKKVLSFWHQDKRAGENFAKFVRMKSNEKKIGEVFKSVNLLNSSIRGRIHNTPFFVTYKWAQ